jgi:hypothetical protein
MIDVEPDPEESLVIKQAYEVVIKKQLYEELPHIRILRFAQDLRDRADATKRTWALPAISFLTTAATLTAVSLPGGLELAEKVGILAYSTFAASNAMLFSNFYGGYWRMFKQELGFG